MRARTFGLDIGTTSIKAVWLKKDNNQLALESIVVAPSSVKGFVSESPLDQKLFADSLKGMLKSSGINTEFVNMSLPESQVYARIIEMPELSEKELSAALIWEMEQYIPLPLNQVKTDWQILERRQENGRNTLNVLIVAAPVAILGKFNKILELIGISASSIETEIFSIHRAVEPLISTGSDLIVHIGASTTDIAITKNKIINSIYSIPLGGLAITRAISSDLGIATQQAESYKKVYGLSTEIFDGKIGKSLDPILQSIIGDVKKLILSYKEKNPNENLSQVVLSGGSSLLPGIDVFFTDSLGTQVVVGNCFQAYNIKNVPEEIVKDAPSYNVVVGLALRDLI